MTRDDDADAATRSGGTRGRAGAGDALRRGDVVDKFVVLGSLGAGGMGMVLSAYDPSLDRKVALKLLHPGGDGARLVREAQAMARLGHPNVVTVYEAGSFGDEVYIAMELVEGGTLRKWLRERPRSWREVVAAFVEAGRGLAAAHRAGIIHRDFKPDNVLVGADGRVRVTDFGLAAAGVEAAPPSPVAEAAASPLDVALTATGELVGTPAYIAPEAQRGAPADQFAFCVSLYEGLYGERPFDGTRRDAIRSPPPSAKVPAWLRAVVLRGLALDPAARHPSLEALLEQLGRDPAATRRRLAAGAGLVGLIVAGAVLLPRTASTPRPCGGAERRLAGVWDSDVRARIERAFAGSGAPQAADAFARFAAGLDAHARAYTRAHAEACEATRVRGEQSEVVLDLRMACLGRRLGEAEALIALYEKPDAAMIVQAPAAVQRLSRPAPCAELDALSGPAAPPRDARTAVLAAEVRRSLDRADAFYRTGRYAEGHAVAGTALVAARAVGHPPVVAEALFRAGYLSGAVGEPEAARVLLHEAVTTARAARHDEIEADAWTELVWVLGKDLVRPDDALRAGDVAGAVISSMHDDGGRRAMLDYMIGEVLIAQGRHEEGLARHRLALARREQLLGPDHLDVAKTLHNIAGALYQLGRIDEAADTFEKSLQVFERALGPRNLLVGRTRGNLGEVLRAAGRLDRAEVHLLAALDIVGEVQGPSGLHLGYVHTNLGALYHSARRLPEARASYERARTIFEATRGPDHPDVAYALQGLGEVKVDEGDAAGAVAPLERSLAIRTAARTDPVRVAESQVALARALSAVRPGDARAAALLGEARATLVAAGPAGADVLARVDAIKK